MDFWKKLVNVILLGLFLSSLLGGLWFFGLSNINNDVIGGGEIVEENYVVAGNESLLSSKDQMTSEFRVTEAMLSDWDEKELEKGILDILAEDREKFSVVLVEKSSGKRVEINSEVERLPGSISKVPYAILLLKEVEKGNLGLDSTLILQWWHKAYSTDELWYQENGSEVTVKEILEFLIVESDNTAMTLIEDYFGGVDEFNRKISEIGITGLTRYPHITTADSVAKMMEGIESGRFLDTERNEYLIDLMGRTNPKYHDRIVAGLPAGTKFAHKIGQLFDGHTEAYNDAAIVFGRESDYVLVVLSENVEANDTAQKIERISQLVYQNLKGKGLPR